jgi:hypothetical protein
MKPHDFGKKYLTEQCQKIKMTDLVKATRPRLYEALLSSLAEADGHQLLFIKSKTGFGGKRFWFCCPICNSRVGILYKHPTRQALGCRKCLNLTYRKQRYHKMVENGGK